MVKFAFRTDAQKQAVLACIKRHAPEAIRDQILKLAVGLPLHSPDMVTSVPAEPSTAGEEHVLALRDRLREFIGEIGLSKDIRYFNWIDKVVNEIRPSLVHTFASQPALHDRLMDAPLTPEQQLKRDTKDFRLSKGLPPHQPDPNAPLGDVVDAGEYNLLDVPAAPKPPILPKNQKISPNKAPGLFTKRPQNMASSNWGLRQASEEPMSDEIPYEEMLDSILEVADLADDAGLLQASDRLACIMPAIRTIKLAQYEGFQNYWVANGRAFEMAYKQKRSNGKTNPEEFRSPHEVWWEILDEYQSGLLTNHGDFIAKYAGRDSNKANNAASQILMQQVSKRVEAGSSPGVAVYEAIDELSTGKHVKIVADSVSEALKGVATAARDGGHQLVEEKASSLAAKTAGWFGNLIRKLPGFQDYGNPTTSYVTKIEGWKARLIADLNNLSKAAATNPVNVQDFYKVIAPIYPAIAEFADRAKLVNIRGVPALPDPENVINAGQVDPAKLGEFSNQVQSVLQFVSPDMAQKIDSFIYKHWPDGLDAPAKDYLDEMASTMGQPQPKQPQVAPTPQPPTPTQPPTPQSMTDEVNKMVASSKDPNEVMEFFKSIYTTFTNWKKSYPNKLPGETDEQWTKRIYGSRKWQIEKTAKESVNRDRK